MWTNQLQKDLTALINEEVLACAILRYRGYARKAISHAAGSVLGNTMGQLVNGGVINELTKSVIEKGSEKAGEQWVHSAEEETRNELPKLNAMLLAVSSTRVCSFMG